MLRLYFVYNVYNVLDQLFITEGNYNEEEDQDKAGMCKGYNVDCMKENVVTC